MNEIIKMVRIIEDIKWMERTKMVKVYIVVVVSIHDAYYVGNYILKKYVCNEIE